MLCHFYFAIPYLGLHNAQDFAQILYFAGGVRIINKNNVFHSFFRFGIKHIFTDVVLHFVSTTKHPDTKQIVGKRHIKI